MLSRSDQVPSPNTQSNHKSTPNHNNNNFYRRVFSRNSSPKLKYGYHSDNAANMEYRAQHHKWGDLRSKIKMMKLDHITVRTYKNQHTHN